MRLLSRDYIQNEMTLMTAASQLPTSLQMKCENKIGSRPLSNHDEKSQIYCGQSVFQTSRCRIGH